MLNLTNRCEIFYPLIALIIRFSAPLSSSLPHSYPIFRIRWGFSIFQKYAGTTTNPNQVNTISFFGARVLCFLVDRVLKMYILGAHSVHLGVVYPLIRLFTKGFVCFLLAIGFQGVFRFGHFSMILSSLRD